MSMLIGVIIWESDGLSFIVCVVILLLDSESGMEGSSIAFNVQSVATIENWLYRQILYLKYLGYRLLRSLSFSLLAILVIVVSALALSADVPISAVRCLVGTTIFGVESSADLRL